LHTQHYSKKGNKKQRAMFAFKMYDSDRDKFIGLMDLHIFLASLPTGSIIWLEVKQYFF